MEFQQALQDLGYYPETASISGHFGKKTEQAVRDFQRDYGLTADGVVGPATLKAIRDAVSGSSGGGSGSYNEVIYNLYWPSHYSTPYNRRAMVLTVGTTQFVCSIYPQPHGQQVITNNNFNGQFCVHFRGSTINSGDGGSVPDSENHQAIITKAVTTLQNKTVNGKKIEVRTDYP